MGRGESCPSTGLKLLGSPGQDLGVLCHSLCVVALLQRVGMELPPLWYWELGMGGIPAPVKQSLDVFSPLTVGESREHTVTVRFAGTGIINGTVSAFSIPTWAAAGIQYSQVSVTWEFPSPFGPILQSL